MMKEEFEEIAGYTVTEKDYRNVIEPMYMALNVSKKEFVEMVSEKRFSAEYKMNSLIKAMKKAAKSMKENAEANGGYEYMEEIEKLAEQYAELLTDLDRFNIRMSGQTHMKKLFSCSYIDKIEIVNTRTWNTIETIKLVA